MISRCCTTYKLADLVYSGGLCFWGWISVVAIYAVTLLLFPHVWESSIVAVEERIMNEVDLDRSSGVVEDVDVTYLFLSVAVGATGIVGIVFGIILGAARCILHLTKEKTLPRSFPHRREYSLCAMIFQPSIGSGAGGSPGAPRGF